MFLGEIREIRINYRERKMKSDLIEITFKIIIEFLIMVDIFFQYFFLNWKLTVKKDFKN